MNDWTTCSNRTSLIDKNVFHESHVKPKVISYPEVNHINDRSTSRCHSRQRSTSPIQRSPNREIHARDRLLVTTQRKTTKKRQSKKSNPQPKSRKTKKDIPTITNMFKEVPPVVDKKGERSDVQVFSTPMKYCPICTTHHLLTVLVVLCPCHMAASRHQTEVFGNTTTVQQPGGQPSAT